MANRIKEAEECIVKAEKHLKTSLTKWKSDFDSAAMEYDRAAICFKNADKLEQALDAYLKSATCYEKHGNHFHSARSKEQAAVVAKQMNLVDRAKDLMQQAAELYAESGSLETSAMALEKTGKFFEDVDLKKSIEIYEKGLQLVPDRDASRLSGELQRRITCCYLKLEDYKNSASNIRKEIEFYTSLGEHSKASKLVIGLVIVDLAKGDPIEAEKDLESAYSIPEFCTSLECSILKPLIRAHSSGAVDEFSNLLNHHVLKSCDNEFLRLIKRIKPPASNATLTCTEPFYVSRQEADDSDLL